MDCPHCGAKDQSGYYCENCGQQMVESLPEDKKKKRNLILIILGCLAMVILTAVIMSIWMKPNNPMTSDQPVIVNKDGAETPAIKELRKAAVLEPRAKEDGIVGYWAYYTIDLQIEKIGDRRYRVRMGDAFYEMNYDGSQYRITDDTVNYYFYMDDKDSFKLTGADRPSKLEVENPIFPKDFVAERIGRNGMPMRTTSVNPDAFNIVGQSYGQLAGKFGPGSVTVINDRQFIVFRGSGGNFAVAFDGATVPLSKGLLGDYEISPLQGKGSSYSLTPLTNVTPGNNTNPTDPNTSTGTGGENANTTTPKDNTTDKSKTDNDKAQPKGGETYRVEVPKMPSFPSNNAIATGVVWADLGFLVPNMEQTMSVNTLSEILGVPFEVGPGSEWLNGYEIYGGSDGYFAANYSTAQGVFKISGYGRDNLDRDKTTIFIQWIS